MATKFVSALTGPEMDQALIDMAYHNSEAYAVGTRNGVAVGSSDVTYHNNSKYWAEQVYGYTDRAEDAANRAEAAVPAGTAGAVFFDRAQTLTTAQQEQVRANIMAGGSNRNLLDNPWFTVNQRGLATYTASGYTIDRWQLVAGAEIDASEYGITFRKTNSAANYNGIRQYIGDTKGIQGKTVTFSVLSGGSVYSTTFIFPQSGSDQSSIGNIVIDGITWQVRVYASGQTHNIYFRNAYSGTFSVDITAVKLELGSVSTLANDAPPKYEQALLDCEYRCVVYDLPTNTLLCRGIATSTTNIAGVIDLPRDMAEDKTPTVSITGSLTTPAGNTITAVSAATYARKNKLRVNFTGTGFTGGTVYDIFTGTSTPKITISADL